MHAIELTPNLSVSGQISPDDVTAMAQAGFTVLVCNRPDGESPDQPTMAAMAAACGAAGIRFVEYPVNPMTFPGDDPTMIGDMFSSHDAERVFAYCRTGTRCTNLWVATRPAEERAAAIEHARGLGFDLSLAMRMLG
jgi:uncharacterized protein (TIGR01244 family)